MALELKSRSILKVPDPSSLRPHQRESTECPSTGNDRSRLLFSLCNHGLRAFSLPLLSSETPVEYQQRVLQRSEQTELRISLDVYQFPGDAARLSTRHLRNADTH